MVKKSLFLDVHFWQLRGRCIIFYWTITNQKICFEIFVNYCHLHLMWEYKIASNVLQIPLHGIENSIIQGRPHVDHFASNYIMYMYIDSPVRWSLICSSKKVWLEKFVPFCSNSTLPFLSQYALFETIGDTQQQLTAIKSIIYFYLTWQMKHRKQHKLFCSYSRSINFLLNHCI